jgi:hypothetical protein
MAERNLFVLLAVTVLVLAVLGTQKWCERAGAMQALAGYWTAPAGFCSRAGLADMTLMLMPEKKSKRLGYLSIMRDDSRMVCNQPIEVITSGGWRRGKHGAVLGQVHTKHLANPAWPEQTSFAYDPRSQRLQIYNGDTTFAVLYRDGLASSMITQAPPLE